MASRVATIYGGNRFLPEALKSLTHSTPSTTKLLALHRGRHYLRPAQILLARPQLIDKSVAKMSESQVTLRTRKFIRNPLLGRKQMVVCVQPPADFTVSTQSEWQY